METELKLLLPPEGPVRLEAHQLFQGRPAEERHLVTTYFDTPDARLASAGLTLRVRQDGANRVQTLKSGEGFAREEAEWPIQQDVPDPAPLAGTPAGPLLARARLLPGPVTDIRRRLYRLDPAPGAVVEAALDQGWIAAGPAVNEPRLPVCELELELKQGPRSLLYRLALELHPVLGFTIGYASKAARGARLRDGAPAQAVNAPERRLAPDATVGEAFRAISRAGIGHVLANQKAAAAGDAEGVHQLRVGVRRLRASLVLFAPLLPPAELAPMEAGLRRLGRVFGLARDWDVFCLETLAGNAAEPWAPVLEPAAAAMRAGAHAALRAELAAPELTRLLLTLAEGVEAGSGPGALSRPERPLHEAAPKLLRRLDRTSRKRGRHIGRLGPEDLHRVRKALKKLRYGAEDVAAVHAPKQVRRFLRGCKEVQAILGDMNDQAVAGELGRRLSAEAPALAPAAQALADWAEQRQRRAHRGLKPAWAAFRQAPRFWK